VAAEREPCDDGALDPAMAQQRRHVRDRQRRGIGGGVRRVVALAMPPHIPDYNPVPRSESGNLPVPHPAGRGVTVTQQNGWAPPMILVIDLDAVAVEEGHARSP